VFTHHTVWENLEMGGITLPSKQARKEGTERVLTLFAALKPRLKQRGGTKRGQGLLSEYFATKLAATVRGTYH